MIIAKEAAREAQDLALYAKVNRADIRTGQDSGIPVGFVGVYLNEGAEKSRQEFMRECQHEMKRGPVMSQIQSLQHKDVMVLIPDKYFSYDSNNCKEGEMLIKIPNKDKGLEFSAKMMKAVVDVHKAMDSHKVQLHHSAVDVVFTPESLIAKKYYRKETCRNREFSNTESFVKYVQQHGPKKFVDCEFKNVDFRLAEKELKRRCECLYSDSRDKFDFSQMQFTNCNLRGCQTDSRYINVELNRNNVRQQERMNDFGEKVPELVMDNVRTNSRDTQRGARA